MALVTANGLTVYDFQMRRPRIGAWHADMLVESEAELTGRIALVIDDGFRTFNGTAVRTGEFAETAHLRVVAGAGGLGLAGTPRPYNATSLGIVLGDLLRTAGETLSPTADAAVLATPIPTWTTTGLPIGVTIAALVDQAAPAGTAWRMLADGTFWIGPETWPAAGVDVSTYQIMDEPFEESSIVVHLDRPAIDPGTVFEGRRVDYVQDDVPHTDPVQARLFFTDGDQAAGVSRARASLQAIAAAARTAFDYRHRYWARIVAQSGRTIDVEPEDQAVPGSGRVRLVLPPGESADGIVGGRVLLAWDSALAAMADGFDGTETVGERVIAAAAVYTGQKAGALPPVQDSFIAAFEAYMDAVAGIADPIGAARAAYNLTKSLSHDFVPQRTRVG